MSNEIGHSNVVPEILLYEIVDKILQFLQKDSETYKSEPEKSFLYTVLKEIGLLKHKYLDESIDLFSRSKQHPRNVDIRLFFDAKRAVEPTVHISLSGDDIGPVNAIGVNEETFVWEGEEDFTEVYGRSFNTSLMLICTSSSHHEVLLMYHVLRACIIAVYDTFELSGFQNVSISGRELQIRDDLTPNGIFSRGISIKGFYEVRVREIVKNTKLHNIMFDKRKPIIP